MRRLCLSLTLGALVSSCSGGSGTGSTSTGSESTESCPIGTEGCPCTEGGACDPGLTCLSNICVNMGDGTTSSDDGATGSSSGGTSSTGDGGTTSSGGTSSGTSGTTSSSGTTGTTGTTGSSGTSGTSSGTSGTSSGGTTGTTGTTSSSGTSGTTSTATSTTTSTSSTGTTTSTTTSGTTTGGLCSNGVTVLAHQKISDTEGNFTGTLDDEDELGDGVATIGDIDDDGMPELLVGAFKDDDGGTDRGAVWTLFLNADGTVKSHQKISDTQGGFTGTLDDQDHFGRTPVALGDFDGDGVNDALVGASLDDDGGNNRGAAWLLLLNDNGTVKSHQKISDTQGGFTGELADDLFGIEAAPLADLDGDGVTDIAVGAAGDNDGALSAGALWILFQNADGTVKSHQKISATEGGFSGALGEQELFGRAIAAPGDIDGDGVIDLAVGAANDDDGGTDRGAVWIVFLNSNGTVSSHQRISETVGGFVGPLERGFGYGFGYAVAEVGDVDANGVGDIAVGHARMDEGGVARGAIWVLLLKDDGTVQGQSKISDAEGGFTGTIADADRFGSSIAALGDLDNNGVTDIAVGAVGDDDGGTDRGAVWILFLECA